MVCDEVADRSVVLLRTESLRFSVEPRGAGSFRDKIERLLRSDLRYCDSSRVKLLEGCVAGDDRDEGKKDTFESFARDT